MKDELGDLIRAHAGSHWHEGRGLVCYCGAEVTWWSDHLAEILRPYINQQIISAFNEGIRKP